MKKPVNVEPGKQGFQPTAPKKLHIPTPSELAARALGIEPSPPADPLTEIQTMHEVLKRKEEPAVAETVPDDDSPIRLINHQPIIDVPYYGFAVVSYGYDPNTERLEVQVERTDATGPHSPVLYAYQKVPRHVVNEFLESPSETWQTGIGGFYEYPSKEEADTAGWTTERCADCGQWKANDHTCPFFYNYLNQPMAYPYKDVPLYKWDAGTGTAVQTTVSVPLPHPEEMERLLSEEASEGEEGKESAVILTLDFDMEGNLVYGFITIYRKENNQCGFVAPDLKCLCPNYKRNGTCEHTRAVLYAIRVNMGEVQETDAEQYEEEAKVLAGKHFRERQAELEKQDWARDPELFEEARKTWRADADVLYSENPRAFLHDMREARRKAEANRGFPVIEYARENVLDGMCQRGNGQAFGVEIEYEFPSFMTYEEIQAAQRRIGEQLFNLGLTYDREQQNYGESKERGFRDEHTDAQGRGNWSWERDGSVAGEIVSPGMYDEPETWDKLQLVLRVLKANGAVAGIHSGAHVHVGSAAYKDNPAAYTELARLVSQHEDVIARLSSDPRRGTHRSSLYAQPLPHAVPPEGFRSVPVAYDWQQQAHERYTIINFSNCLGDDTDHVEIRAFDSTLDPGTVQAQIMLAVGIVNAAERNAQTGGTRRGGESWGTHAEIGETQGVPSSPTAFVKDSRTMMSFIDTVFRRREDKARMAAVAYHTKWSKPMQNDSHYENLDDDLGDGRWDY